MSTWLTIRLKSAANYETSQKSTVWVNIIKSNQPSKKIIPSIIFLIVRKSVTISTKRDPIVS